MPPNERTALYRHFDALGNLLYIGISLSPFTRLGSHKQAEAEWYEQIARIEIRWFPNREAAALAEAAAIIAEMPRHNVKIRCSYLRRKARERAARPIPKLGVCDDCGRLEMIQTGSYYTCFDCGSTASTLREDRAMRETAK